MNKSYRLYLTMTSVALLLISMVWGWVVWMMHPSLSQWGPVIGPIGESVLLVPILIGWTMWIYMVLVTMYPIQHPILLRLSNRGLYLLFPLVTVLARCFGYTKDEVSQSLIALINHLVSTQVYRVEPERLLLLTPHCIQLSSCVHKVTTDVHNCKRCGGCQVGTLLDIADTYGCHFVVVTGGTLARLKIKEIRPQAIVAIACERDLVSGMADVFPIPVIGVLNERPCGPCCNTRVNTEDIRLVIERLLYGNETKERT